MTCTVQSSLVDGTGCSHMLPGTNDRFPAKALLAATAEWGA